MIKWTGTPIYARPSRFNGNCGRVFARDMAGQIVAEFLGENGYADALEFCRMFGEKNHWRVANSELIDIPETNKP
jgi:hypothetical protein